MNTARKRRLCFILFLLIGVSAAVGAALVALRQNINLYFTPSQLWAQSTPPTRIIRVGGIVRPGSVQHSPHSLVIRFILTDSRHQIPIVYDGLLPSLFREGQGVVVEGYLNTAGTLVADQVLAKHDATYHPPGVDRAS